MFFEGKKTTRVVESPILRVVRKLSPGLQQRKPAEVDGQEKKQN